MATLKKKYLLEEGMILEREYYGKSFKLIVIKEDSTLRFKLDNRVFDSLTAAARYVFRDETRQVNGPEFWKAPQFKTNKKLK